MTVCRSRFDFFFDSNYAARSLALPYIRHATSEILFFALCLAHVTLRCCTPSCTLTISSCWTLSCTKIFQTYVMPPRAGHCLALPHIRHATLLGLFFHLHTYVMLRCSTFCCTSTHTSCHAIGPSLALPHICHAMLPDVFLNSHPYVMLPCWTSSCVSTHTHTRHATLLDVVLHFHTHVTLRCWMLSCTSSHTSRYAAGPSPSFPHIRHARRLDVFLHFHTYVMLRCRSFSCQKKLSTKLSGHKITVLLW